MSRGRRGSSCSSSGWGSSSPAPPAAAHGAPAPPPATSPTVAIAAPPALAAVAQLDLDPVPAEPRAVELLDSVLGVPPVLHLDEREAGGLPGDPDIPDSADLGKGVLDVKLVGVVGQAADVDLALWVHPGSHGGGCGGSLKEG